VSGSRRGCSANSPAIGAVDQTGCSLTMPELLREPTIYLIPVEWPNSALITMFRIALWHRQVSAARPFTEMQLFRFEMQSFRPGFRAAKNAPGSGFGTSHKPVSREFAREWQFNGLPTTRPSDLTNPRQHWYLTAAEYPWLSYRDDTRSKKLLG
jgi:hypothetical protein